MDPMIIRTPADARKMRPGDSYVIERPLDPEEAVSDAVERRVERLEAIIAEQVSNDGKPVQGNSRRSRQQLELN